MMLRKKEILRTFCDISKTTNIKMLLPLSLKKRRKELEEKKSGKFFFFSLNVSTLFYTSSALKRQSLSTCQSLSLNKYNLQYFRGLFSENLANSFEFIRYMAYDNCFESPDNSRSLFKATLFFCRNCTWLLRSGAECGRVFVVCFTPTK